MGRFLFCSSIPSSSNVTNGKTTYRSSCPSITGVGLAHPSWDKPRTPDDTRTF